MSLQEFVFFLACAVLAVGTPTYSMKGGEPCLNVPSVELQDACKYEGLQLTSASGTLLAASNCNVLLPKQVFRKRPKVLYGQANRTKLYTVVAVDPDAPHLQKGDFYLHWVRTNIPGSALADNEDVDGLDIAPYMGPNPPADTGDHRYLFLVYEQRAGDIDPKPVERKPFNMDKFKKGKHLCGPVAGVQFRSMH